LRYPKPSTETLDIAEAKLNVLVQRFGQRDAMARLICGVAQKTGQSPDAVAMRVHVGSMGDNIVPGPAPWFHQRQPERSQPRQFELDFGGAA
jgi:hypothetical protein